MSTFHGGPADGVVLALSRAPLYLRVVQDAGKGGFDALNLLEDEPRDGEIVWVYRMVGRPRFAFVDYRDARKGRSGRYDFSDYEFVEVDDETQEQIRDTTAWRAWVDAAKTEGRRVEAAGFPFPIRACPPREMGQR